jgi:hypothetical protein
MANKFAVKSLDHLVLTVRSIPRTVAWYTTYLGMRHEIFTSPLNQAVQRYYLPNRVACINTDQKRHALIFGSQKINLHQSGKEFEPKAQDVMPGSADLCFLTDENIQTALAAFEEARIEVCILGLPCGDRRILMFTDPGRCQDCRKNWGGWKDPECICERSRWESY